MVLSRYVFTYLFHKKITPDSDADNKEVELGTTVFPTFCVASFQFSFYTHTPYIVILFISFKAVHYRQEALFIK